MADTIDFSNVQLVPQGLNLSDPNLFDAANLKLTAPTSLAGNLLGNITWPKFLLILGVGAVGITLLATPAYAGKR